MADRDAAIWSLRGGALVLILADIPLALMKKPTYSDHVAEIALVIGALVLVAWGQWHKWKMSQEVQRADREELESHPRLVVKNPKEITWPLNPRLDAQGFTTGDVFTTVVSGTESPALISDHRERIDVAHLHVTNEPINKKSKQKAENVTLSIRYLRDGEEIMTRDGRWSGDSQLNPFEWSQRASERTIAPNLNPERFDVAIKYPEDDQCFAMDDTVRFHQDDWRKYPLGNGPVEIEVTARQSGEEPVVTRWRLTHGGPGGSLHLDSLG